MDTNRYESEDYRASSVFGRVSGCQRPMPSLYINYYLCHCNGRLHSNAYTRCPALHCGHPLHISSVGRFASSVRATLCFHPSRGAYLPARGSPSLTVHPLSRSLFAPAPAHDCRGFNEFRLHADLTWKPLLASELCHLPARKFSLRPKAQPGCLRDFVRRVMRPASTRAKIAEINGTSD